MNLNLYGHDGHWLMIDCGVSFNETLNLQESAPTFDVVAPDPAFISSQSERLSGIVITHAHEDHVGAIPFLWQRFKCAIYTTPFTAAVLRRKLAEVNLLGKVPIHEVDTTATVELGPFTVKWLQITHSIPEPFALKIATSAGTVLHTADWKIDAQPITGAPFQHRLYQQLGEESVLALVGDSTNALKPGMSVSERNCYDGLLATIKPLKGRVVVGCFASNIARLVSLARIAKQTKRYMAVVGRSLHNMVGIAKQLGYWPDDLVLADANHLGYLPPEEVLLVATGSQGESRAALARMARDDHPAVSLGKGDQVIFSSIVIPGNEASVSRLIKGFHGLGVSTLLSEESPLPIHASGHPCEEELKLMYHWVKPQIAIPVHGEKAHIDAHCEIAKSCGVRKTYSGSNGDLYKLAPQSAIHRQKVRVGRIAIER